MSLINDALKRVKQAPNRPARAPEILSTLEPASHRRGGSNIANWLTASASCGILFLAVWFLWLWWRNSDSKASAAPSRPLTNLVAASAERVLRAVTTTNLNLSAAPIATEAKVNLPTNSIPTVQSGATGTVSTGTSVAAQTNTPPTVRTNIEVVAAPPPRTNEPPVIAAVPEPALPDLKLQGVFYRGAKSSALINGQTLFLGDDLEGAKVIGIERHLVRLLIAGRTNVLKLR